MQVPKKRTKTDQINKDETVKLSNIFSDYIKPGCSTNTHIKNQESEITLESHHPNSSGSDLKVAKENEEHRVETPCSIKKLQ